MIEDTKTASDINVTHKLPAEVEQRFDDYFPDGAFESCVDGWIYNSLQFKENLATEQVALLTRVLGLIEDEKLYSNEQLHGHNNNNLKTRNKLRAVFRDKVQAILKEYE